MDNVKDTAAVLQAALDNEYAANVAANDNARRLAEEKLMYANEKTGTVYSGLPTWQRANLGSEYAQKLADIDTNYANSKISLWNNVQDTIDKIRAYNEAAADLGQPTASYSSITPVAKTGTGTPFMMNGKWYTYSNGQLKEVK